MTVCSGCDETSLHCRRWSQSNSEAMTQNEISFEIQSKFPSSRVTANTESECSEHIWRFEIGRYGRVYLVITHIFYLHLQPFAAATSAARLSLYGGSFSSLSNIDYDSQTGSGKPLRLCIQMYPQKPTSPEGFCFPHLLFRYFLNHFLLGLWRKKGPQ